jgi:hypothetical protein
MKKGIVEATKYEKEKKKTVGMVWSFKKMGDRDNRRKCKANVDITE